MGINFVYKYDKNYLTVSKLVTNASKNYESKE